jgi:hypothetical protein
MIVENLEQQQNTNALLEIADALSDGIGSIQVQGMS